MIGTVLLLIRFYNIVQCVVEGILTEQLPELVTTLFLDIVQDLRNNKAHPFFLQYPVKGPQRLRHRDVYSLAPPPGSAVKGLVPARWQLTLAFHQDSINNNKNQPYGVITECLSLTTNAGPGCHLPVASFDAVGSETAAPTPLCRPFFPGFGRSRPKPTVSLQADVLSML